MAESSQDEDEFWDGQLRGEDELITLTSEENKGIISRTGNAIRRGCFVLLLPFLIGLIIAPISFLCDFTIDVLIFDLKRRLTLIALLTWSIGFVVFSIMLTKIVAPQAAGSGIPEIKALLGGSAVPRITGWPVLFVKTLGLISTTAAGLSVGREGPFVHIAVCIASRLLNFPLFKLRTMRLSEKLGALTAAVAAGVTATFGAPVGGLIFSIEITATYFLVSSLWRGFFACTVCFCTMQGMHQLGLMEILNKTEFENFKISKELFAFILLGIVCGVVAAIFVRLTTAIMRFFRECRALQDSLILQLILGAFIATGIVFVTEHFPLAQNVDRKSVSTFLSEDFELTHRLPMLSAAVFVLVKLMLTMCTFALPVPAGFFGPTFAAGAALGRFFGLVARDIFPEATSSTTAYAVVGAAALAGGVTHTLSVSVIVFELTGELSLMLPVLVGVLASYGTATCLSLSIYDSVMVLKNLPFLPKQSSVSQSALMARDVAVPPESFCLALDPPPTLMDLFLCRFVSPSNVVPVVENLTTFRLVGLINSVDVDNLYAKLLKAVPPQSDEESGLNPRRSPARDLEVAGKMVDLAMPLIDAEPHHPVAESPLRDTEFLAAHMETTGLNVSRGSSTLPQPPTSARSSPRVFQGEEVLWNPNSNVFDRLHVCVANFKLHFARLSLEQPLCLSDINVDKTPLFVVPETPLARVVALLSMLALPSLLVVDRDRAVIGVVTKHSIREVMYDSAASLRLPRIPYQDLKNHILLHLSGENSTTNRNN